MHAIKPMQKEAYIPIYIYINSLTSSIAYKSHDMSKQIYFT